MSPVEPFELGPVLAAGVDTDPSGAQRAREAHDAGAVEPVEVVPNHTVELSFRVHGRGAEAKVLADAVAATLATHPLVEGAVAVTVTERDS